MARKAKISRKIRRRQAIDIFGVGSIWDAGGESFVACDITRWPRDPLDGQVIKLRRLAGYLSGKVDTELTHFRAPPVPSSDGFGSDEIKDEEKIPYYRFPQWLACSEPDCNRLTHWNTGREEAGELPCCRHKITEGSREGDRCGGLIAPVRLILVCPRGHMQDVPWHWWLHAIRAETEEEKGCRHEDGPFLMRTRKEGGGSLYAVVVECEKCGASGSLGELLEFKGWPCKGRQPWGGGEAEKCPGIIEANDENVRIKVTQRGDANVTFPFTDFALDIPPDSRSGGRVSPWDGQAVWKALVAQCRGQPSWETDPLTGIRIDSFATRKMKKLGLKKKEAVRKVVEELKLELTPTPPAGNSGNLRYEEWRAFVDAEKSGPDDNFRLKSVDGDLRAIDPSDFGGDSHAIKYLQERIDGIRLCTRLREVRALKGFSRVGAGEDYPVVPVDLGEGIDGRPIDWLPAVEVFGEGIFIQFKESMVYTFENKPDIADRFKDLPGRLARSRMVSWAGIPDVSSRFVMLHTLAHILIKQLAFECGYPAASLREIVYSASDKNLEKNEKMAGILVYTSEADSGGSLGGLVSQGRPERLLPLLLTALRCAEWCSSDPLCREFLGQGRDGLNQAACHACSLLAETSCGHGNVFLDRMMVVGEHGFLSDYDSNSGGG